MLQPDNGGNDMDWKTAVRLSATGVVVLGAAVMGPTAAFADTPEQSQPAVVVTPSTDLEDGAAVSVGASGFGSNQDLVAIECARPDGAVNVCNTTDASSAQTDEQGAATTSLVVRRTFQGNTGDGSQWGTVDCDSAPAGCVVVVLKPDGSGIALASISFRALS
jgi:Neocarzinostatin family